LFPTARLFGFHNGRNANARFPQKQEEFTFR
jgi:hypothetical protein